MPARQINLTINNCFKCKREVRVGLMRCPFCARWLQWDKNNQSKKLRHVPTGNLWGKVCFQGKPEVWLTDGAGKPVSQVVPDQRIYVVGIQDLWYALDDGLFLDSRYLLISQHQNQHGRINAAAKGFASVDTPFWDPDKSHVIRDLTLGTRVEILDTEDDYVRIGEQPGGMREWIWQGFMDQIIAIGVVGANAKGFASVDTPFWDADRSIINRNLIPGERVEIFQLQDDYIRIGPNEWIWKGFVKK